MAKLKISDYSSTSAGANLNTDINSIDIDEGCAPSGINNAIRTLMAQLKDFQTGVSGDSLTLGGALSGTSATFSGDLTVDTNTLYVDSTNNNIGIGTSSPNAKLHIHGGDQTTSSIDTSSASNIVLNVAGTGFASGSGGAMVFSASDGSWKFAAIKGLLVDGSNNTSGDLAFSVRNATTDSTLSEAMRIKSNGNVGIGASSPTQAGLVINKIGTDSNTSARIALKSNETSADTYMRIGRFGTGDDAGMVIGNNYNRDGGSYSADYSSYGVSDIVFGNGQLSFGTGAAGATNPTTQMTIDSSGNVGIGASSPAHKLHVNSAGSNLVAQFESTDAVAYISFKDNSTSNDLHGIGANGDNLILYSNNAERMRIDTSGHLLIGTTSTNGPSNAIVVGGIFRTQRGNGTAPTSTSQTLFTITTDTTYLVTVQTPNASGLSVTALVHYASGGNPPVVTTLKADSGNFIITLSGTNVRITNNLGGVVGYVFNAVRIF